MTEAKRSSQIKSKKRVAEHGEVFTAQREVNAMLDLVDADIRCIYKIILEPAVGEGVFLLEILNRRFAMIDNFCVTGWELEWDILQAISSLYGVDIQSDNVTITRNKIISKIDSYVASKRHVSSAGFKRTLGVILQKNIIIGDTLSCCNVDKTELRFSEWQFYKDGVISRREYTLQELINNQSGKSNRRLYYYAWMKRNIYPSAIECFSNYAVA